MKLLILFVLSVTAWADVVDYSGYRVYTLIPRTEKDIQRLWEVKNAYNDLIDFWRKPASVGVPVDLLVPGGVLPGPLTDLLTTLHHVHADVMIQDVQELMDTESSHNPGRRVLDSYSQYGEIGQWVMDNCQGNCNLVPIGESYQGRQMYVAQFPAGDIDTVDLTDNCDEVKKITIKSRHSPVFVKNLYVIICRQVSVESECSLIVRRGIVDITDGDGNVCRSVSDNVMTTHCEGACPSSDSPTFIFDDGFSSRYRSCTCCHGVDLQPIIEEFNCAGGSRFVTIQNFNECECGVCVP